MAPGRRERNVGWSCIGLSPGAGGPEHTRRPLLIKHINFMSFVKGTLKDRPSTRPALMRRHVAADGVREVFQAMHHAHHPTPGARALVRVAARPARSRVALLAGFRAR